MCHMQCVLIGNCVMLDYLWGSLVSERGGGEGRGGKGEGGRGAVGDKRSIVSGKHDFKTCV